MIPYLLILSLLGPFSGDASEQWHHRRETSEVPLEEGAALAVINPFGSIRVRGWEKQTVSIIANIQKRRVNPAEAAIETTREPGKLTLEAVFPGTERPEWAQKPRRIDLTVLVPEKVDLTAIVTDDLLEIKGTRGNLNITSGLGNIAIQTHGAVTIKSRQGRVEVLMLNPKPDAPSHIQTVHGTTSITLPTDARADVTVRTAGKITSDYSTRIATKPESREKQASIEIGGGGQNITIVSHRGAVEVLRRY